VFTNYVLRAFIQFPNITEDFNQSFVNGDC